MTGATIARFFSSVHAAEAQLSAAEVAMLLTEARIRLTDIALATARQIAAEQGIDLGPEHSAAPATTTLPSNLSEAAFARLMGVSARTIANDRRHMTERLHYHRHGRRILYHVPEAADFIRQGRTKTATGDATPLAIDEVTRRRARVALRKASGR